MKALLSVAPGGPDTLELQEIETPEPGAGEVRIRVRACGVNFPDALIIEDKYQFRPDRPFSPGGEVAGEIDAVGAGATPYRNEQLKELLKVKPLVLRKKYINPFFVENFLPINYHLTFFI